MSVDQVIQEIQSQNLDHVVLTGGEPMLFDPIVALCQKLRELGKTITIETAGTIFRDLDCDLMSISPKLAHSTPIGEGEWERRHEELRLQPDILRKLMASYDYQLKFVVSNGEEREIAEIESLIASIGPVPADKVLLMPEGRDQATLWLKAKLLIPIISERNWRLAPRLQIDLFGDTRGT
jgi:7-carboxy-7-deazaguanine synthase